MKRIFIFISALCVSMSLFSVPTFGFNYQFLHDSTVQKFDKVDWDMVRVAMKKALNAPGSKVVGWKNKKSGNGGYLEAFNQFQQQNMTCRNIYMFNHTTLEHDVYHFTYCKTTNGWKIVK